MAALTKEAAEVEIHWMEADSLRRAEARVRSPPDAPGVASVRWRILRHPHPTRRCLRLRLHDNLG